MSVIVKSADLIRAKNGSLTVKVNLNDEQSFFLHSTYSPEQEAQEWLKNIQLQTKTAYVVFGVGLGYHIKALLAVLPANSHVFSIEPSTNGSFLRVIKKSDPKAVWLSDERFSPLIGNDIHDMSGLINKTMQQNKIKRVTICHHFPTMQIESDFYAETEKELVTRVGQLYQMDYEYQIGAGGDLMINAWTNLPEIFSAPGTTFLKDKFKGMPAIMVAGGPSLDKNIHILKEYADKAIIICAGSTMGTLAHHGIKPHFLVALDPFPGMEKEFEGFLNEETYLLACYTVPNALVSNYPGPKIFCKLMENTPNGNVLNGLQHLLPETDVLYSNVSVATTAVGLALHIGADPIIIVGQDLSFGEDLKSRADGSKAVSYFDTGRSYEDLVSVPGYYGGEVKTLPMFKVAIEFYASLFSHVKERQFINATEGGAYLNGAKHMSLQEAAAQHINNKIDVFSVLKESVPANNNASREDLCDYLRQCMQINNGLLEDAAALLVATDPCPGMILAGDIEGAEQELKKMISYFDIVRNSAVYIHLITYLNPLMQSFYNQEEYVDLEEKFLNYIALFSYIRIGLDKLNELMNQAILDLEKSE